MKTSVIIESIASGLLTLVLTGMVLGFPVMWLWNYVCPELFGLPEIDFWKALGLYALTYFLFKTDND